MKYCSQCGSRVSLRVPDGDSVPRHVCGTCGYVHYRNPRVITGCIAEWEGGILLCRRAIEPRRGFWTLPAGFMENGETVQQGAMRETWEEAGVHVDVEALFAAFTLPHINQLYMLFRGCLQRPEVAATAESLESALFGEADIPWNEIAFPVVRETLRLYVRDRAAGRFSVHVGDIVPEGPDFGRYQASMLSPIAAPDAHSER